jgi:ubiquinone/menaquinone biosynthesis C-methylase UbiE
MGNRIEKRNHHHGLHASKSAFWMIHLMHDNPLLPIFRDPYKLLKAAGLQPGQKALEVGCGPGYFTIPASKIVAKEGLVYAVDIHPLAIERIKQKIEREGVKNVMLLAANASDTGLPDGSIDLAFLFGLRYISGGLASLLSELHRVLKPGGTLAFEKTRGSEKNLIKEVERGGFAYSKKQGRIFSFAKGK